MSPRPAPAGRARPSRRESRGAALLLAITSIAVITALALELAYDARVSVQLAGSARDELRAYYLAKSGINLARLVLHFQQRLDAASAGVAAATGRPGGGPGIAVKLWEVVPVSGSTLAYLGGMGPAGEEDRPGFGGFLGDFEARVDDEDHKVNIRQFDATAAAQSAQVLRLAELVKDDRWDFLFDRDDANGIRVSRKELLAALKDWADVDETSSTYNGSPISPFESSYGDENGIYDRLDDRYKAKNARFDSLDELYMVAGVSDAFMAAFGDRLTVYPDLNGHINVNTDDPRELVLNAVIMGGGAVQPPMLDPAFLDNLRAAIRLLRPLPFMVLTTQQFAQILQGLGIQVAPQYLLPTSPSNPFGDRATTFRIRATGKVGGTKKALEAVVTFDARSLGLSRDLGRLIHWHEE